MKNIVAFPASRFSELRQDIRYGLRILKGSPGFTAGVVLSLSLGIAIAACAYSEVNALIFRDIPGVPAPDQLVALQAPASFPDYKRYSERSDLFSSTLAYVAPVPFGVTHAGQTERLWGHLVTSSYFSTLGVHPSLGRFFDPGQEQLGQIPAAVVSYRFWQEHMGADRSVIGRTLRINGQPVVIIGVGPKDFLGASPGLFGADLWLPVSADSHLAPELANNALERRELRMFQMTGRLRPGVTLERAEAELDAVARQLEREYGDSSRNQGGRRVRLVPGGKVLPISKQDRPFFAEVLMLLAGLVLLIACSNVANMMLARATNRQKEIAIRLAMGSGRSRIVRQLLTESLLFAAGAGIIGFLISMWLMRLASTMRMPYPMPVVFDLNPDWHALLFALAVTAVTGLLFGLAPALQITRADLTPALKQDGGIQLLAHQRFRLRNAFMLCQMAGSLTLLMLTGFLGLGIQTTMGIQQGFNPRNLYLISLDPVRDGYSGAQTSALLERLLERVKNLQSITAACLTDTVPVAMDGNAGVIFSDVSAGSRGPKAAHWARKHIVGPDYFETVGTRILSGGGFRKIDSAAGGTAVIVSEELVRAYWPGQPVLGRRIRVAGDEVSGGLGAMPGTFDFRLGVLDSGPQIFEVVGVVQDVSEDLVAGKKHPAVYFALHPADYAQPSLRGVTLIVRAAAGADAITAVRREIAATDPILTPYNSRSMIEQIEQFMSPLRSAAWTWNTIGAFGLILASVGLAGLTAYSVARRSREIGIRIALGAETKDVLRLVMKESAILVAVGAILGMGLTWAGIRALSAVFFSVASVQSFNPALVVGAPLLLTGVSMLACYLPARKAALIDPAVALRQE